MFFHSLFCISYLSYVSFLLIREFWISNNMLTMMFFTILCYYNYFYQKTKKFILYVLYNTNFFYVIQCLECLKKIRNKYSICFFLIKIYNK